MVEQNLATILDILRADAQEFSQIHSDNQDDLDLVVRAWQEEVDRYTSQAADYRAAMSLARAIYQDRNILGAIDEEERRATEDRGIAIGLAEGEGQQAPEIERAQQPGMTILSNRCFVVSSAYISLDRTPPTSTRSATPGHRRMRCLCRKSTLASHNHRSLFA